MTRHTTELQPGTVVTASPKVRAREIGGEAVLVDLAAGEYYGLNEVGTVIWEELASGATLGEARATVVETFEVGEDRAWADLVDLVRELLARGLVEVRPGSGVAAPDPGGAPQP